MNSFQFPLLIPSMFLQFVNEQVTNPLEVLEVD